MDQGGPGGMFPGLFGVFPIQRWPTQSLIRIKREFNHLSEVLIVLFGVCEGYTGLAIAVQKQCILTADGQCNTRK